MDWYSFKLAAVELTALSRDALHILVGVAAHILVALAIRRSLAHPVPWLAVLFAALANEYYDLAREEWTDKPMWPGSARDVVASMAVPTALFLLARYAPGIFVRAGGKRK